ncbi:amidase [Plastorhodobacter daqingensis]|uniref:Amidase n=1 Tax=Plastorhodobacter daqingensis TaxID=1387281 RepID=A0ABW2URU0_9RHOB
MGGDWLGMTASDLGRGIGAGRVDPVALTEAFLDAARQHPHADRIYARLTPERALAEARAARDRARLGLRRGLLDGVPLSWKDLFDTAGVATEAGSALLAGRTPDRDAEVLVNASLAGSVCLGKTHLSELAFSGLGLNPVTATSPCIHDAEAVAGGSSSGAAASVAFGLAPCAIGSDTGGSVRIPAAWNDLVGLKTTLGRLPMAGTVALCERFDTIGPLARSTEDAAEVLALLEGKRAADLSGATLSGARLLVLETLALDDLRPGPARGFDRALDRFAAAGAHLTRGAVPEVAEAMALAPVLFAAEAYGLWRDVIEAQPERMYPPILERFRGGAAFSGADYVAGWKTMARLRQRWSEIAADYDAVVLPTAPTTPPKIERLLRDPDYYVAENLLALRNTRIANLFGLSALTLPTGEPSAGVMLMGAPLGEERLLRLGAAAERALGRG